MITAFSWGYKGWGNHTRELVRMVDAVEAARGFGPPLFADVRIRRAVRAEGFRERAFEQLLGERYVWLRGLGNRQILDPASPMALLDPDEADRLLELARVPGRRVILFCSCGSPAERATCHRRLVVDELVRRARLTVQEWPGGAPVLAAAALARRGRSLVLPDDADLAAFGALPHCSILQTGGLDTGAGTVAVSPAVRTSRGWVLPVHDLPPARARCEAQRRAWQLEPFGVVPRERAWRKLSL